MSADRLADHPPERTFRAAQAQDAEACVALWVEACAARDGRAVAGVAERARARFGTPALWLIADPVDADADADADSRAIDGFVLATPAGTGGADDPPEAVVLALLAIAPRAQGSGLGRGLLRAAATGLAQAGHPLAILHVLTENTTAVRLYESEGWRPHGEPFEHTLLHRPSQRYALSVSCGDGR